MTLKRDAVTGPQEIECKFDVEARHVGGLIAALSAAFGPAARPQPMSSVYFDTGRLALRKRGLTLRVRQIGCRHVQTVKQGTAASGGLFRRREWETEVAGCEPDLDAACKTPVAKLLKRHRRRLAPVFETAVERIGWRVAQEGAVVEIVLDRGEVRTRGAAQPLCEVEFELKEGSPAALFAALRHLQAEDWLAPAVETKSDRGFTLLEGKAGAAAKAEPIVLDPTMSTGTAVQVILRGCLRQFRRNAPLLAGRHPEPLHQARVGLRRLRSAVALFSPALHDDAYDHLADRLRVLSRQLGAVRDLDVYLQRLAGPETVRPDVEPGGGAVLGSIRASREAAYDRLLDTLGAPSSRRLMMDLFVWIEAGAWLTTTDTTRRAARERPIAPFAAELLAAAQHKVSTKGRKLKELTPAARHRLRIAAKKLRYATDFTATLARRPADRARHEALVKALEALQADLGDLNDIATGHVLTEDASDELNAGTHAIHPALWAGHAAGKACATEGALLRSAVAGRRAVLKAKPFWSRW